MKSDIFILEAVRCKLSEELNGRNKRRNCNLYTKALPIIEEPLWQARILYIEKFSHVILMKKRIQENEIIYAPTKCIFLEKIGDDFSSEKFINRLEELLSKL